MRWTIQHYIRFLRRQHVHLQHLHAFIFAGAITMTVAFFFLYFEYGFFHESYDKQQVALEEKVSEKIESPTSMLSNLFNEGKERFSNMSTTSFDFLKGKETYTK